MWDQAYVYEPTGVSSRVAVDRGGVRMLIGDFVIKIRTLACRQAAVKMMTPEKEHRVVIGEMVREIDAKTSSHMTGLVRETLPDEHGPRTRGNHGNHAPNSRVDALTKSTEVARC